MLGFPGIELGAASTGWEIGFWFVLFLLQNAAGSRISLRFRWGLETLQCEGRGEVSCLKVAFYIVYVGFLEGG